MNFFKKIWQDQLFTLGLITLAVVLALFWLPFKLDGRPLQGVFVVNFGLAILYLIIILFSGRLRKDRNGLPPFFLFLLVSLVSAYTLNREIEIFDVSADWLSALLAISSINYIAIFWYNEMPRWMKFLHVVLLCLSLCLFVYLAIYLIPQYLVSAVIFWVLLLPMHTFVPLLFVIYTIFWLRRIADNNRKTGITILSTLGTAAAGVVLYLVSWAMHVSEINRYYREAENNKNGTLPVWVKAAAKIPANPLTERILKTDTRFATIKPVRDGESLFWNIPSVRRNNEFRHDPLICIATAFGFRLEMPVEDRVQMLQAVFNERHQAEERLWSGDELYTEEVDSKINIWPQYRIAYTDMTIKVACRYEEMRWRPEQEAIYSFNLPEGSAVTALSLWIDGNESPGILTTKSKADSAYKTIVGREARDPSVLHWQEGNRVSVRVFPVFPGSFRRFRVGITTPLQMNNGKMEYQSVAIEGPSQLMAKGPVSVRMMGESDNLETPPGFKISRDKAMRFNGRFKHGWSISMAPVEMATGVPFHFNGHSYSVKPYQHQRAPFQAGKIYLDINKAWTMEEYEAALQLPGKHEFFVAEDEQLVQVTEENRIRLFKGLHKRQFSLFPVHNIKVSDSALLITKGPEQSPNLNELKGTTFLEELKTYLAPKPRLRLFCIDGALQPYLRSLKEYRVFHYDQGSMDDCSLLLARKEFSMDIENDNQVVIDHSNMMITRKDDSVNVKSDAPDHLMRLFAYNHIMQQA
ncbi:MAG: XrtN system VIT domain-containing protein, partial [Pseudobacter sp.]|uniref:XrtN system VIT domain-containing protein n=1 Tax=Pseudobacter sp. TaxID=2045420 RepID=UPI003F81FDEA